MLSDKELDEGIEAMLTQKRADNVNNFINSKTSGEIAPNPILEIADDAFVHVTTPRGAENILKYGLDPDISGFVTKWKYIKDVTDPKVFNTKLYRQDLWMQTQGKFDNGFNILRIDAKPTFYSPRTNWVNGLPQYKFNNLVAPSKISLIK